MDELEDFNRFSEEYCYPYVHFTVNVKETEKIDDVNVLQCMMKALYLFRE